MAITALDAGKLCVHLKYLTTWILLKNVLNYFMYRRGSLSKVFSLYSTKASGLSFRGWATSFTQASLHASSIQYLWSSRRWLFFFPEGDFLWSFPVVLPRLHQVWSLATPPRRTWSWPRLHTCCLTTPTQNGANTTPINTLWRWNECRRG